MDHRSGRGRHHLSDRPADVRRPDDEGQTTKARTGEHDHPDPMHHAPAPPMLTPSRMAHGDQSRTVGHERVLPRACVLGPIEFIGADGRLVDLPSATQRRLLALLAVRVGTTVRSEVLAECLGVTPAAVRKAVSRLRSAVGDALLHTDPIGYRLAGEVDVDAVRFVRATRAAADANDPIGALDAVLALWHGEAIEEFGSEPWARADAARLSELRWNAIEDRAELLIVAGREAEAIAALEQHIDRHPPRDRPRGLLIRALAAAGRQADALRAYQSYRAYLAEELGTEPSAAVTAVERQVARDWDVVSITKASDASLIARPSTTTLPVPVTTWVGPTAHLDDLAAKLPNSRVMTLIGPGGVGKTRTAIEVARRAHAQFPDGVWHLLLASIDDPDGVASAVASSMRIQADHQMTITDSIIDWLRDRRALLVLDNCEHVIEGAADLVSALTRRCDTVTVLSTSRERLGVDGERIVDVNALSAADSASLFRERAASVGGASTVATTDAAITAICARLDHLPLAIELAAARTRSLAPVELLARLDDRFSLLHGGRRHRLSHHTGLRATVDWSYRLLSNEEQVLFDALSAFAGSFDLAAAEAVGADPKLADESIADLLASLIDKSMVAVEQVDSAVRYRQLETLREYGRERVRERRESDAVGRRHLTYFAAESSRIAERWLSAGQREADVAFDAAWDDIRAALAFACSTRDLEAAERIHASTMGYATHRVRSEHAEWGEAVLALFGSRVGASGSTVGWTAWWATISGDGARGIELCQEWLSPDAPRRDPAGEAICRAIIITALWASGRRSEAGSHIAALDASLPHLDPWTRYHATRALFVHSSGAEFEQRAASLAALAEQFGAPSLIASARYYQGQAKLNSSDPDHASAVAPHQEGIQLAMSVGAHLAESQNLVGLLEAKRMMGASDTVEVCAAAMRRLYDLRYWLYLWRVVDTAASVLASAGRLDAAAAVIGYLDANVPPWRTEPRRSTRAAVMARPGAPVHLERARVMGRDELVRYVIDEVTSLASADPPVGERAR